MSKFLEDPDAMMECYACKGKELNIYFHKEIQGSDTKSKKKKGKAEI